MSSMGGHQSAAAGSTTWLTPRHVLDALGGWEEFDLDPCAAPAPRPWPTAWIMNSENDSRHWQAKVRQKLQQCGRRIDRNAYMAA